MGSVIGKILFIKHVFVHNVLSFDFAVKNDITNLCKAVKSSLANDSRRAVLSCVRAK